MTVKDYASVIQINENTVDSILPKKKSLLKNTLHFEGNYWVHGSAYGKDIKIKGPGIIEDSVAAAQEITITREYNKNTLTNIPYCIVNGGLSAGQSILVDYKNDRGPHVIDLEPIIIICGDVYSRKANLKNAIIMGNLCADDVVLDSCIVLGCVFCDNLKMRNSSVMTFHCNEDAIIQTGNTLLTPYATAKNNIKFIDNPNKKKTENSIRYLPFCQCENEQIGCGESKLFCMHYLHGDCKVYAQITPDESFKANAHDKTSNGEAIRFITLLPKVYVLNDNIKNDLREFYLNYLSFFNIANTNETAKNQLIERLKNNQGFSDLYHLANLVVKKDKKSSDNFVGLITQRNTEKPHESITQSRLDKDLKEIEHIIDSI